ncbi:polymeric immunoglobulin receptor-like isoform X2 [Silurus asotus]|nr:polymeric immunoglobulin receptor-like isoform X2 [Silurus asotus]
MWVTSGRFSLFDDTKSTEFRVMIREITVEDTEKYHCGIGKDYGGDTSTPVTLKVQKGSSGSGEVSAYTGGRINIKCRYEDKYKDKPKSICKIGTQQLCFPLTTTKLHTEWTHNGRFSVYDNRSAGFFNAFIRELIMEDTGTYLFTVAVSDEIETSTVINLTVTKDLSHEKSISKTVQVGEDLNISCKYPESLRNYPKFLCKRHAAAVCPYKISVTESRKYVNFGKFSLYDDRTEQIFTVSIRNVAKTDSGEFWCGAEAAWTSDHEYKVYFTQINLTVTDSVAQNSVQNSESDQGVPLVVSDYEEIKDTKRSSTSEAETSTVYPTAQIPTNTSQPVYAEIKFPTIPCDSAINSTTQLPTIPSDPSQTVYAAIAFPTISCDSEIYSTAQLPTIPSDQEIYFIAQLPTSLSAEKSVDGLTHATVSSHSNATSSYDAVPHIKEDASSVYTSVSHVTSSV